MESVYLKLEDFIYELFKRYKEIEVLKAYNIDFDDIKASIKEKGDLLLTLNDRRIVIEIKAYKSNKISISLIRNAINQLNYFIRFHSSNGGILIVTSNIDPKIKLEIEKEYKIKIWDRGTLLYLTSSHILLRSNLESILLQLMQSGEEDIYENVYIPEKLDVNEVLPLSEILSDTPVSETLSNAPLTKKGHQLCEEAHRISAGIAEANEFEKHCENILKYLFSDDLALWESQNTTDDTLHRFDLIAKIASKNDFWRTIARDFKSRFVVFEFKNYTDKIKQNQIYTTEKYLYLTALRSIAVIISRQGADDNAIIAMNGALREHGKLIICLNLDELCKMLKMKDKGDDPNSFLSDKIDNMLMKLAR